MSLISHEAMTAPYDSTINIDIVVDIIIIIIIIIIKLKYCYHQIKVTTAITVHHINICVCTLI